MDIINWLIELFKRDVFTAISNVSAIAGLIISFFVLIRVKRIERNYTFRIRVPALSQGLYDQAQRLINHLNDYQNEIQGIREVLAESRVYLESLQEKVNRDTRKPVKVLLNEIYRYSESHEQLNHLSYPKSFLYRIGLYHLRHAGLEELKGENKRDDIYRIYLNLLALKRKLDIGQEDRRLD